MVGGTTEALPLPSGPSGIQEGMFCSNVICMIRTRAGLRLGLLRLIPGRLCIGKPSFSFVEGHHLSEDFSFVRPSVFEMVPGQVLDH